MKPICSLVFFILNIMLGLQANASNYCFQPCYCWNGFYAGVHGGFAWYSNKINFHPLPSAVSFVNLVPTHLHVHPNGGFGGAQIGYNYQRCAALIGLETDFSGGNIKDRVRRNPIIQNNGTPFPGAGFLEGRQRTDWFGTLRFRLGYAQNDILIYGTGGLAYAHVNNSADTDFRPVGTDHYPLSLSRVRLGWAAGVGLEYGFCSRWSVKGEYLLYDLSRISKTANSAIPSTPFQIRYEFENRNNFFRFGLNYRI